MGRTIKEIPVRYLRRGGRTGILARPPPDLPASYLPPPFRYSELPPAYYRVFGIVCVGGTTAKIPTKHHAMFVIPSPTRRRGTGNKKHSPPPATPSINQSPKQSLAQTGLAHGAPASFPHVESEEARPVRPGGPVDKSFIPYLVLPSTHTHTPFLHPSSTLSSDPDS